MNSLQNDIDCMVEASFMLETQNNNLEKKLGEKKEQLEIAECDIYRLEQTAVSDEIMQDADLVQGLTEALEQNKQVFVDFLVV